MKNIKQLKFWNFGGMYYFYFMIWALIFAFLPFWLDKTANLSTSVAGLVFSAMAVTALILEPIYGLIQDKLGLKKIFIRFCCFMPFIYRTICSICFSSTTRNERNLWRHCWWGILKFMFKWRCRCCRSLHRTVNPCQ